MAVVYLLLGTNLGDKKTNLALAKEKIHQNGQIVTKESSVYETDPWGFDHPERFYNQVISINTTFAPERLMTLLLNIEKEMGRTRNSENYESRTIDIDILFYGNNILKSDLLTIPHPRMHLRRFTLEPLNDIAPMLVHPILKKTIQELLKECTDKGRIKKIVLN
jgi:2-amino-4-hydroxy-6-hydroxymethyldihydropteridine diphosphokinase